MKKRIFAALLALTLVFTGALGGMTQVRADGGLLIASNPNAGLVIAPNPNAGQSGDLSEENMSQVILALKAKFKIGDEYTRFDHYYYENAKGTVWNFEWYTEDYSKYISVTCDGLCRVMNCYRSNEQTGRQLPVYTTDELLDAAKAAVDSIAPELQGHITLESVNSQVWDSSYRYYFNRIENGIEMPDNTVMVALNYVDGSVIQFNCTWLYDEEIPSAEKLIGEEAAAAKIKKNVEMTLKYYLTYDENGERKAFLAYTPDKSYVAVDAKSGKLYFEKNYWSAADKASNDAVATEEADEATGFVPSLSEAELEKIALVQNLMTAEEALKVIKSNKSLFVDKDLNSFRYTLSYDEKGNYFWNINMNDNRPYDYENGDYYRAYASAVVNADTGEIRSYNASLKSYYDFTEDEIIAAKANYTKTQCKRIFTGFLEEVNGERFANTEMSEVYNTHEIAYDDEKNCYVYAGFGYRCNRVNEGIQVVGNGIYGAVDAISGKVYSYSFNWDDDVVLPSSADVIGEEKAFDSYIGFDGFDLVYEVVDDYTTGSSYYGDDVDQYVRLVYRTAIAPYFVDAKSGKQLNYNGSEYEKVVRDFEYTDIEGTKYERAIRLLASLNVGFEGSEFKPDQAITRSEFQQLAEGMTSYFGYTTYSIKGSKKLTRQYAAKAVAGYLGYDKIAKLDIFKTGYSDASKISKGYTGYVAMAKGLNIMGAVSGKRFKPKSYVTRGEAAQILLNAIGVSFE